MGRIYAVLPVTYVIEFKPVRDGPDEHLIDNTVGAPVAAPDFHPTISPA
jgi:hypothetical protein